MSILSGLRVIEISSGGSAAWATKHFADWGAEVTILEPASGTPLRDEPPLFEKDGARNSATWTWLSRGKQAIRVGSRKFSMSDAVALCQAADVLLIESELCRDVLGQTPAELQQRVDGATSCVLIEPFAAGGPYAGYRATELGATALGGWMSQLGDPRREPVRPGFAPLPRVAGIYAFVAALLALRHLEQGGAPQFVELSLQGVAASICTPGWLTKSMSGLLSERIGNLWPLGVMECADGYVGVPPLTATHWELLCQLMEIEDVLALPEGRSPAYRMRHSRELYERVKPWLSERTRAQVFEEAQAWRLPSAQVQTIADRLACPQLAARGFWQESEIDGVAVKVPRVPYSITGVAPVTRGDLKEIDSIAPRAVRAVRPAGQSAPLPFEGLRVLDLTAFWSGPYATMLLGALGADVIKIESIQRPDPYRYTLVQPDKEHWFERSPVWNDTNCDKRSLTLDLSTHDGKTIFERLVLHADVVISNFSNRVMPNLGLTNQRLLQLNPQLIAVTMPGYGPGGPWEEYVGYAIAFEQLVIASMTGYADGPPLYGGGFCDPLVGMHTVAALTLALRQREQTGRGLAVEVTQCEVLDSILAPEAIAVQLGAPVPGRRGNKHAWMAPHNAYRVAGRDAWLTIAVSSDEEFAALGNVLGQPDLARDVRFAIAAARKENEVALDETIAQLVLDRDGGELERELQAAGVHACRVIKAYELDGDPGLQLQGFFQSVSRETTGTHVFKTWPFRFSDIDTAHKRPPPLLGEHNDELLRGLLGLSAEEIAQLASRHVIGREPTALAGQNA
jgi:crotonobetainyl-CoA:carnitine CoA-transferase CaiB-like acyl-CoA transferase